MTVIRGAPETHQRSPSRRSCRGSTRLARDLHAPLERIEGARHFTPEDQPEAIAKGVRALLDA